MRIRLVAAGLALLALAPGGPAVAGPPARPLTIQVTIRYSRFHPATVAVPAGATVRFVVRNGDPIGHEFILGDRAVQDRHEQGTEAEHGAIPGEMSIPAGATRETTVRLGPPGALIYGCHLPGHYAYGMRGLLEVV